MEGTYRSRSCGSIRKCTLYPIPLYFRALVSLLEVALLAQGRAENIYDQESFGIIEDIEVEEMEKIGTRGKAKAARDILNGDMKKYSALHLLVE
jgi:hypothetical protein